MNLPNVLTMVRFAMVPTYLVVYFSDISARMYWSIGIVLFAGLTDVVDGYLARRNNQVTQLGAMLDPLADKLMMIAVFLSLLFSQKISIWAALVILIRDGAMIIWSAFFHFQGKKTVPANFLGKLTTVLFYIALFLLMLDVEMAHVFLWGVILLSYFTTLIYLFQLKAVNEKVL